MMASRMQRAGQRWAAFQRLSRGERRLLLEAVLLLPLVAVALRWFGLRRTQALLVAKLRREALDTAAQGMPAEAIAAIVAQASRHTLGRPRCLAQALVLWRLLRRAGQPADLRIGVRKPGSLLQAHAWVECGGAVLDVAGGGAAGFAPFAWPLPDRSRAS